MTFKVIPSPFPLPSGERIKERGGFKGCEFLKGGFNPALFYFLF